jgi:8-oxo-dGTP diphosphatase
MSTKVSKYFLDKKYHVILITKGDDLMPLATLHFYETVPDTLFEYAVIIAKHNRQWVLCKHKKRDTYEIPGGKREPKENILTTAKRELYEETGAIKFTIEPFTPYSVIRNHEESFGMIFIAEIKTFAKLPISEMEKIILFDTLPPIDQWTYPTLQPLMIQKYITVSKK